MKKIGIIFIMVFVVLVSNAQQNKLAVFVSNHPLDNGNILVRWIGKEIRYTEGVNIYRKKNQGEWVLITSSPILMPKELDESFPGNQKSEYGSFITMTDEEFNESFSPIMTLIKSIKDYNFALGISLAYEDKTVEKNETYEYKVEAKQNGTISKGVSLPIVCETYKKPSFPDKFIAKKSISKTAINWEVDEVSHFNYTLNWRAQGEETWVPIINQITSTSLESKKKYKYKMPTHKDSIYECKLIAMDYFGQLSEENILVIGLDDVEAPEFLNTDAIAKSKQMECEIHWTMKDQDIKEYNVWRSSTTREDSAFVKINATPISGLDTNYIDKLTEGGIYFYKVEAIDSAGNKTLSPYRIGEILDLNGPNPPANFKVAVDTGKMIFTWDPVKAKDFKNYFIVSSLADANNEDNQFTTIISDLDTNYYELEMAKNVRNKFVYQVKAVDTSYNTSKPSNIAIAQLPDVTPPGSPFIKRTFEEEGAIAINWMKNAEKDLAGYNLFRKIKKSTEEFEQLNVNLIPKGLDVFLDKYATIGVSYEYYLVAVDESGLLSKPSNSILGKRNFIDLAGDIPVEYKFNKKKKEITIVWHTDSLINETVVGVSVFKSINNELPIPVTKVVSDTKYKEKLSESANYHYHIRAYGERGSIIKSKIITITTIE